MTPRHDYTVSRLPRSSPGRAMGRRFAVKRDGEVLITLADRPTAEAVAKALRFALQNRGQESHLVALWQGKPHVYAIA